MQLDSTSQTVRAKQKQRSSSNDYSKLESAVHETLLSDIKLNTSVVIPFYRELPILDRTLASLTLQDYPKAYWDVIIVEDGSIEDSQVLINRYNSKLRIRKLRQKRIGRRLCAARNLGIDASDATVIVLLDFDCVCMPNFLSNHLKWFALHFPLLTFGLREFVDLKHLPAAKIEEWIYSLPNQPRVNSISNKLQAIDKRLPELQYIKHHPLPCNCFHGCNAAFRREDARLAGLFDTTFDGYAGYEDIEFCYRLTSLGRYLVYVPDAPAYHQENDVVRLEDRIEGKSRNLQEMFNKVPGIMEFRKSIGQDE